MSITELGHLERTLHEAQTAMRELKRAEAAIAEVSATGEGAGGLILVTADGHGRVVRVHFDPRVMRLDRATLGAEITAAVQAAQRTAMLRSREIMNEVTAQAVALPDPPGGDFVRDRVEQAVRSLL